MALIHLQPLTWDKDAPRIGWSGETCLQMAFAYRGIWSSQLSILRATEATANALSFTDIPATLTAFGFSSEVANKDSIPREFFTTVRGHMDFGRLVIGGFKRYPTKWPSASTDRMMLYRGYYNPGDLGMNPEAGYPYILNTTTSANYQVYTQRRLLSGHKGFSVINRHRTLFACAVVEPAFDAGEIRAQVYVYDRVGAQQVIRLYGYPNQAGAGKVYQLTRDYILDADPPVVLGEYTSPDGQPIQLDMTVDFSNPARFRFIEKL